MDIKQKTKEIDIIDLARKVLSEKKTLGYFIGISAIVGIIVALNKPKVYTAEVVLAPELSSGGLGMSSSITEMASSFGIDLGTKSSMDAIYPEIYPDIFASNDFITSLFDVNVRRKENNETKTYFNHLVQDSKTPFWNYPLIWIKDLFAKKETGETGKQDIYKMSKTNYLMCEAIRGSINCLVDKKTSVITISMSDEDPLVAAIMCDTLQKRLQEYITDYRTKKARNDFNYYDKLYKDSKEQYLKAQKLYAYYSDTNNEVLLQSFKMKQEELENEMQLKYNIYTQMTAQRQNARAKIQERTPAFSVIQKATMPMRATSTPRSLIVVFFIFLGTIADALWILYIRSYIKKKK